MRLLRRIISLIVFCGLLLPIGSWATPVLLDSLKPRMENVKVDPKGEQNGVLGVKVSFDLVIPRPGEAELPVFLPEPGPFTLRAFLLEDGGTDYLATDDAPEYQGAAKVCRDSIRFIVPEKGSRFSKMELFIPFFAIDKRSGHHKANLRLELSDLNSGQLIQELEPDPIEFDKPPLKLLRLSLKRFSLDSTDVSGGNWDFHLLNEEESKPDPEWKLARGRFFLYQPRKRKNTFEYEGTSEDLTPLFTLSEGDKLELIVDDFDLTSYSDQVGSFVIDPWQEGFEFSTFRKVSFGSVNELIFAVFGFYLPELQVKSPRVEHAVYAGVTGTRLHFDYKIDVGNQRDAGFYLELFHAMGNSRHFPQNLRVVEGPAEMGEDGHLTLLEDEGGVDVFVPHYGMEGAFSRLPGYLVLVARVGIDEQKFTLLERFLRLPSRESTDLNDVKFTPVAADEVVIQGQTGVLIQTGVDIPEFYLDDKQSEDFRLKIGLFTPEGQVDPAKIRFMDIGSSKLLDHEILLSKKDGKVPVKLFVPYQYLPASPGSFELRTTLAVRMGRAESELLIGEKENRINYVLSPPEELQIRIPYARSKKYRWMEEEANLCWRVYLGNDKVYESPIVYRNFEAKWRSDAQVMVPVYPEDEIRIEILHYSKGRMEHPLGRWTGNLSDLLKSLDKGRFEPKMAGLKNCVIQVNRQD